jgi:hypothetical protein
MRTITDNGNSWIAHSGGCGHEADNQKSMSVRFWCAATGHEVFGRLQCAIEDFDKASIEDLTASLVEATDSGRFKLTDRSDAA